MLNRGDCKNSCDFIDRELSTVVVGTGIVDFVFRKSGMPIELVSIAEESLILILNLD